MAKVRSDSMFRMEFPFYDTIRTPGRGVVARPRTEIKDHGMNESRVWKSR